jgi:hypothetical protein
VRVADDFTILRSAGSRSITASPWAGLENLLRPLESREPLELLYAALPWTSRPGALKRFVHPIEARRQVRAHQGKAANKRVTHALAVVDLLVAAAQEGPLLCLLDDVPAFDEPSRDTLPWILDTLLDRDMFPEARDLKLLLVLTGGRPGDPFPTKPPGTSLNPYVDAKRKHREQAALLAQPSCIHQRKHTPLPTHFEPSDGVSQVRDSGPVL